MVFAYCQDRRTAERSIIGENSTLAAILDDMVFNDNTINIFIKLFKKGSMAVSTSANEN